MIPQTDRSRFALALPLGSLLLLGACGGGIRGGSYRVYDAPAAERVGLDDSIEVLAQADVVFLGEEHDNDVGHSMQLFTIRELHEERPVMAVSMEQFEADVQALLDAYLAGEIDEESFLADARPWGNYEEHYRPIVEWARENGIPVIAANIPRPLASRVARSGYRSVTSEELTPWSQPLDEPEYERRFTEAMGGHMGSDPSTLARYYDAQCLKDEKMAESIELALGALEQDPPAGERPLVVHLCGKFHSDSGLGTASRLARRRPDVDIAIVSMSSGEPLARELSDAERASGDYLWRVSPMEDDD